MLIFILCLLYVSHCRLGEGWALTNRFNPAINDIGLITLFVGTIQSSLLGVGSTCWRPRGDLWMCFYCCFVIYLCIHGIFPYPFYFYCFACPACDGLVTISWGLFRLLPFLGTFCVEIVGGFVLGVHLFCLEPLNKCDNKVRTWSKRKVHKQKGKSRSPAKQLTIVIFLTG